MTIWKIDGTLLKTIQAHKAPLWGVAFSPYSTLVASAGVDNTVKLWSINGKLLKNLEGHQAPASGCSILWDLEKIGALNPLKYACNQVRDYLRTSVEVNPKDRYLCDI